jgi:hypothetical protein
MFFIINTISIPMGNLLMPTDANQGLKVRSERLMSDRKIFFTTPLTETSILYFDIFRFFDVSLWHSQPA